MTGPARVAPADRAFDRLYRRYVADVYRYAHALLRDPDGAADVTQTTFLNAWRASGRGGRPVNAKTWLIGLAHDVCRRRLRAHPPRVELDPDEPEERHSEDDIRRALGRLPFDQ